MALCKHAIRLGSKTGLCFNKCCTFTSILPSNKIFSRQVSQDEQSNANRDYIVGTLALVWSLEAHAVPYKQAEAIISTIIEVLKVEIRNVRILRCKYSEYEIRIAYCCFPISIFLMLQESNLFEFKSQVQSSQKLNLSNFLQRGNKKLRNDIGKMRSELRCEIDKVTTRQRLDRNLERCRIRDELANKNAEATNLTNELDREIHALRAQLKAAKYDMVKYCIGSLLSVSAMGLVVARILL